MANPLRNEEEIYAQLKKEHITIHPLIWELVDHHIRNDINIISLAIGGLRFHRLWILKFSGFMIKFLHRITFQPGKPEDLVNACDRSLKRVKDVDLFLKKLKQATENDQE
ncbi:MAG: hypothetical protein WCI77_00050 [Candidatus Omnitrophota bacterium]